MEILSSFTYLLLSFQTLWPILFFGYFEEVEISSLIWTGKTSSLRKRKKKVKLIQNIAVIKLYGLMIIIIFNQLINQSMYLIMYLFI